MFGSVVPCGYSSGYIEGPRWHRNVMCPGYSGPWGSVRCPPPTFRHPPPLVVLVKGWHSPWEGTWVLCVWPGPWPWSEPPPLPSGCRKQLHLTSSFPRWITSSPPSCLLCVCTAQSTRQGAACFLNSGFSSTLVRCSQRAYTLYTRYILTHWYIRRLLSVMCLVLFF